jgi:hypothetical protein
VEYLGNAGPELRSQIVKALADLGDWSAIPLLVALRTAHRFDQGFALRCGNSKSNQKCLKYFPGKTLRLLLVALAPWRAGTPALLCDFTKCELPAVDRQGFLWAG